MISFAKIEEIDEIMSFIDKEWRKDHILARDKSFFQWMYVKGEKVHFVVSRNGGVIDGILGFVPYDDGYGQLALAVWRALKSSDGMIGMSMLSFIEKELHPKVIATPGINPVTTTAIYKYFKHDVGKMNHFYRLAKRNDFFIPIINDDIQAKAFDKPSVEVKEIKTFEEYARLNMKLSENAIKKDAWYIRRRYFEHPVFEYLHYIVGDRMDVILREQEVCGHKCLRIVDILGDYDMLVEFTYKLDELLTAGNYEYADCYVTGIDGRIWKNAGWIDVEETNNIIPNYFAPFERKNIDLYYSCKPHGTVIFRGDGDQDRPN